MSKNAYGQENKLQPAYTDTDKMPFGKFVGNPLQDVPAKYLAWLYNDGLKDYRGYSLDNKNTRLANYIWNSRNAINQELGELIIL